MARCILFHVGAQDGAWAAANPNVQGGCGGVSLGVAPHIAPLESEHEALSDGCGVWIILNGLHPLPKFGILCLYAPNSIASRCRLWQNIIDSLSVDIPWILFGDFNMSEKEEGSSRSSLRGAKLKIWKRLKLTFSLLDPFIPSFDGASLNYTWDNERSGNDRVIRRIDRFYLHSLLCRPVQNFFPINKILAGVAMSDHLPVSLTLSLRVKHKSRLVQRFKFNTQYLKEHDFQSRAKEVWLAVAKPSDSSLWGGWWDQAIA